MLRTTQVSEQSQRLRSSVRHGDFARLFVKVARSEPHIVLICGARGRSDFTRRAHALRLDSDDMAPRIVDHVADSPALRVHCSLRSVSRRTILEWITKQKRALALRARSPDQNCILMIGPDRGAPRA